MKRKKLIVIFTLTIITIFFISITTAYAEDEDDPYRHRGRKPVGEISVSSEDLNWYKNNASILSNNSVVNDGLRYIGFGVAKVTASLADVSKGLYDKTFGMIDITQYEKVNALVKRFEPAVVALMCLCLVGLGISYIVLSEKKPIFRNILLTGLVLTMSVYAFNMANTLVSGFKDDVIGSAKSDKAVYEIVNNNIIDLVNVDSKGSIKSLNYKSGRGIITGAGINSKDDFSGVNIVEVLNFDDKDEGQKLYGWSDTFNHLISAKAVKLGSGKYKGVGLNSGILGTSIGNEFYYRYSFDFFPCMLELFSIILLYIALSYKNVRITVELIISRIMALFYSADFGGERLKLILFFIRDTYIALLISIVCVKLFAILSGALPLLGITGLAKSIIVIFIAYAVIDGPNLAERILGIDAGLSSSVGRTMAVLGMAKYGAGKVAGAAKSAASGAYKAGRAFQTGKTSFERKTDSKNATPGEKMGLLARGDKASGGNTAMGSERSDVKSEYKNTSFMNESQDKKTSMETALSRNEKSYAERQDSKTYSERNDIKNTGGYGDTDFLQNTKGQDVGMQNMSGKDNGVQNLSGITGKQDIINEKQGNKPNFDLDKATDKVPKKSFNPEFTELAKKLSPDKNASVGERKDFNMQMNNIVRGDHKAIKPSDKSRAEYKKTNYEKALKLEKAYHKGKEGSKK